MLYTAKGVAALLVPLANVLAAATGSWTAVFAVASALNDLAAALALIALKPARIRAMAKRGFAISEYQLSPNARSSCLPLALFCRANRAERCPVSGVKQPCRRNPETAEVDPKPS